MSVNKCNLYEWALGKPKGNLDILLAMITNVKQDFNITKTKQDFFKKYTFLFKQVSAAAVANVIKNIPSNNASGGDIPSESKRFYKWCYY